MDLRKGLRKGVRDILRPFLRENGFTEFSEMAAWRKGDRWIDCVHVMTHGGSRPGFLGRRGAVKVYSNAGTFSLDLGCYYTDIHLLPWIGPTPERPQIPRGESAKHPTCHRLRSLARSFEYGNVQATLFPVADDGSDLDAVLVDALLALRSRGMTWLESTHDIDAYLARVGVPPWEYMETGIRKIEFTAEEQAQVLAWLAERGLPRNACFYGTDGMPEAVRRKLEHQELRDHTAAEMPFPYGDLYYGLLIGRGRRAEALEAIRRDSDPSLAEARYAQMMASGRDKSSELKRIAGTIRKRELEMLRIEREHLAMLEAG